MSLYSELQTINGCQRQFGKAAQAVQNLLELVENYEHVNIIPDNFQARKMVFSLKDLEDQASIVIYLGSGLDDFILLEDPESFNRKITVTFSRVLVKKGHTKLNASVTIFVSSTGSERVIQAMADPLLPWFLLAFDEIQSLDYSH